MQRNETFLKFQGPETLIAEYGHWSVLARPKQATLGAMVLVASGPQTAFSDLPAEAFAELSGVTRDVETAAKACFDYDKINYLMLMMVDPHVHFHVLPRYEGDRNFEGTQFADAGWPGPPDLSAGPADAELTARVRDTLKSAWPASGRTA